MAKTNKSYSKRLKVTKNGKVLQRAPGQNHFNAKESRVKRLARKRITLFKTSSKVRNRFIGKFGK